MANVTQNVLIDFQVDDSALVSSTDRLEEMGKTEKKNTEEFKKANEEIKAKAKATESAAAAARKEAAAIEAQKKAKEAAAAAEKKAGDEIKKSTEETKKQAKAIEAVNEASKKIDSTGKVTRKTLEDLTTTVKQMPKEVQKAFQQGINEELKKAGVEAQEFEQALNNAVTEPQAQTKSLRAQLKEMTLQLAEMKLRGEDNTEAYRQLATEAGNLKDTIGDAAQEVNNFASDTSTFDGLIQSVQGIAGGFAVAQGAAALFGNESEELQKTLLRVNAAMAILQGLQQLQTVFQKESSAAKLADIIVTRAQTAAQVAFNFVVGTSTGLLKAFRIALAATGIGLLVIGLIELVSAFSDTEDSLDAVNDKIETQRHLIESLTRAINDNADIAVAKAELAGAKESELIVIRGRALVAQRKEVLAVQKVQIEFQSTLDQTSEAWASLNAEIQANTDLIASIDQELVLKDLELQKQRAKERQEDIERQNQEAKQAAEDAKRRREDRLQKEKEARAADFKDYKAGIELQLLAVEKGTQEEIEIRKNLLRAELQIELDNEKLTNNQRKLLIQQFFKDRLDLQKKFNDDQNKMNLADILSGINADLAQLEIAEDKKLEFQINAIKIASYLELAEAEGNASKIAEIEARRDKEIRDARIASITSIAEYEIALASAGNGPTRRRLEQVAQDADEEFDIRLEAIERLNELEQTAITRRIDALNEQRREQLISQKDYDLQYAQLLDQQTQAFETAEQAKTRILEEESAKRREKTIRDIEQAISYAETAVDVISSIYDLQNEREDNDLNEKKARLKELQEAGAITEKEAITRQKKIEAEEKQLRQRQAQRDKQIAVFNAALAIPRAILTGLAQGGPIAAAIYGAIAAAQFAIVAARPIPKFGKGKKDKYEGPAIVGETGPELIESGGRMYVADKETKIWLNRDDKVYNPRETEEMLTGAKMNSQIPVTVTGKKAEKIDYDKVGKSIAKHLETNIFVDGVQAAKVSKQAFTNYLDSRRAKK